MVLLVTKSSASACKHDKAKSTASTPLQATLAAPTPSQVTPQPTEEEVEEAAFASALAATGCALLLKAKALKAKVEQAAKFVPLAPAPAKPSYMMSPLRPPVGPIPLSPSSKKRAFEDASRAANLMDPRVTSHEPAPNLFKVARTPAVPWANCDLEGLEDEEGELTEIPW